MCTSVVAQTPDGTVLHARNLDFGAGMGLTAALKNMTFVAEFRQNDALAFRAVMYAGYVGVLTGVRPGVFSVSVDERFYKNTDVLWDFWTEIVQAVSSNKAHVGSWLVRETLASATSYEAAVAALSNTPMISNMYFIVGGAAAGQGAVITRNQTAAVDVWPLDLPAGRWYVLETNYDHWENPPVWDDRRYYAERAVDALGAAGVTLPGLFDALSVKPVRNLLTTYTALMCARNGSLAAYGRNCPDPCPA